MSDEREESTVDDSESRQHVPSRLADDQFYRALASTQRRRLLSFLLAETESTVDELAAALAGWDAADGGTMATPRDHEVLSLRLVHAHLPLLEEADLVSYDHDREVVSIAEVDDAVADLIRRSVEAEQPSDPRRS